LQCSCCEGHLHWHDMTPLRAHRGRIADPDGAQRKSV
jgi:hypothetical protein